MKIGLFYGSTTCYTEMAAEKIQATFGKNEDQQPLVELHNIKDQPLIHCLNYDIIIFGISTWDYGELQEDWESTWDDISQLNLQGKIVALYGMGDQIGYTDWFQDALGLLFEQIIPLGAKIIGFWPNQGYEFNASKALTEDNGHFVGLALDEDNQYNDSDKRIEKWCEQLLTEILALIDE
jgi:flavodoxin II